MSGAQLCDRAGSFDQTQAGGAALRKGDSAMSTTVTMAAQRTPQSETVILPGMQPVQAPAPLSGAMPAAGDPIAMGMTRI